jgi:hypothetical protein
MWPGVNLPQPQRPDPPPLNNDKPVYTPREARRLDFMRWLVRTDRLKGDTRPDE